MKLTIWADTHKWAPNALKDQPTVNDAKDPNCWLLGDIIDLANCKKTSVESAKTEYNNLKAAFGYRYIPGNHERMLLTNDCIYQPYYTEDGKLNQIILFHGDFESWGPKKAKKYRSKEHGAGPFKRKFIVNAIEGFELLFDRNFKQAFINRCRELMKTHFYQHTTLICGHMHPDNVEHINVPEGKIIVVPRGKTELDIE